MPMKVGEVKAQIEDQHPKDEELFRKTSSKFNQRANREAAAPGSPHRQQRIQLDQQSTIKPSKIDEQEATVQPWKSQQKRGLLMKIHLNHHSSDRNPKLPPSPSPAKTININFQVHRSPSTAKLVEEMRSQQQQMKNEMKSDIGRLERIMMKMNREMKAKKEVKSHKAWVVLDSFRDYQAKMAFMEREKAEVLEQHKLDLESIL